MKQSDKLFITFAILAVLVVGGGISYKVLNNKQKSSSITQATNDNTSQTQPLSSAASSNPSADKSVTSDSKLKDGTYSVSTDYQVPHGESNSLTTKVTIVSDKITDISTTSQYNDHESETYINNFKQSLKSDTVGKNLADISPSRIGGASLTSEAFYETLQTIESNARI